MKFCRDKMIMIGFNFEAFLISFGLIFLAELGDKTQLMVITLSAREGSPFKIGLASSIGISLVAIIGILIGFSFSAFIPIFWIKLAGIIIFFIFGIYTIIKLVTSQAFANKNTEIEDNSPNGADTEELPIKSRIKVDNMFLFPLMSVFLMEFGDKTQIMTITLVATFIAPIEVGLGAILSLSLLCFVGAYIGELIAKKIPKRWVDLSAGIFFIIIGLLMLVEILLNP